MRKIWITLTAIGILSFSLTARLLAADFKKADELFDQGTFQAALEEYDQLVSESKDPQEIFKAFYRSCERI